MMIDASSVALDQLVLGEGREEASLPSLSGCPTKRGQTVFGRQGQLTEQGGVDRSRGAAQTQIGLAVSGEAGARLTGHLGMKTSPNTTLRRVHRLPRPRVDPPRAVGTDDWAARKGRTYGRLLVDLERRCPIDLPTNLARLWMLAICQRTASFCAPLRADRVLSALRVHGTS